MAPKRKSSAGVGQAVKRVQSTSSRSTSKQQEQQQTSGVTPTAMTAEQVTIDRITQQVVQQITPVITAQIDKKLDHILGFLQGTTPGHQPATSSLEQEQGSTATTSALTDQIVQQSVGTSVAQATSALTGLSGIRTPNVLLRPVATLDAHSQSSFVSTSIDITASVPEKIKQHIWAGAYIDFNTLLSTYTDNTYRLQVDRTTNTSDLNLVPVARKLPLSINQWITAWNRFTTIICMKSHTLSTSLSHHMEVVMKLSERRAHWRYYDEQFRHLIEMGEAKWGATHLELYLRSVLDSMGDRVPANSARIPPSVSRVNPPKGACFNHHKDLHCSAGIGCKYQHNCFNCLEPHPFIKCKLPIQHPFKLLPKYAQKQARPDTLQPFQRGLQTCSTTRPRSKLFAARKARKGIMRK
ncbi:hypothetical protein ACJMK2_008244 [Sinanodonta woodiana]|uniref:C3H1-type domain-containing protein n=1 Tax=Sinanodonta woodiana TaxID=1069815 RepID=A0ABD3VL02_SINWO